MSRTFLLLAVGLCPSTTVATLLSSYPGDYAWGVHTVALQPASPVSLHLATPHFA